MTTPNIERQREMKNLLDTVFEEVLKAFAEIDCFSKESSPSIFLVYAHENCSVGNANATWAIQLIRWLRAVRSKTFSDGSLVPGLWATREEENFASVHDILSNQFCLLPTRSRVAKGKRKQVTSVDKVIVCCSEVLESYSKATLMDRYANAIKEFYSHAEREHQDEETIEKGIQKLVRQYRNEVGFHHVITELAFLDIRSSLGGSRHDIIPIVFNGNDITYLRYFDDAQTVWLKVQDDPSMFHPCQALHKLCFKLLRRLYEDQNPSISEFEDLYWKCAQSLPSQGSLPRHEVFMKTISVERSKALNRLERNAYASIRVRPMSSPQPSAIFFVPFKRNANFVGRESIIMEIDQKISSTKYCQHVAIWGLGGTGKTQIALEYAFRRKDATPDCAVFWIPAISTDTFKKAYLNIGKLLKIPGISDEKADVENLVQEKLSNETSGEWLIIVDNADDADVLFKKTSPGTRRLFDFLPSSPKGSIIFTTRTRGAAFKQVQAQENIIEVTEMTKLEAEDLLNKVLGEKVLIQERETADKLLSLLAWLPLAISQAASFIATTAIPLADYVVLFESSEYDTIQMLGVDFDDQTRYRDEQIKNPIATTWLISFEQIQKEDPLAAEYLSFIACLLRENIPQSLLPKTTSKLDGIKAIGTLTAYSFLTRKANSHMFDMHRLVHLVTRNWLKDQSQLATQMEMTFSRVLEVLPYGGHKDYNIWIEYLPHAIKVASSSEEFVKHQARIILLDKIGRCQRSVGQYKVAEETHRQVLELRKSELGEEDSSTLISMSNVGQALSGQGKYTEAEKMHRETLALMEKVLGKEHPETLTSMSNVGQALSGQGKYTEAEKMHRETLVLYKKVLGKEHPYTLTSMNNVGHELSSQGKDTEAEIMHRETLALREKVLGKEHPDTLASMGNVARALSGLGKYTEAEKMYRETLILYKKVLGKEHPDTLASINNVGHALSRQGKHTEAEKMHREALVLYKKVLGKEHPNTLTSMNNVGHELSSQGKDTEAEIMHREILALREKVLGKEHPDTLASMGHVGRALSGQGKYTEAEKMYRETLVLDKKVLGKEHPDTLTIMNNVGHALSRQGKHTEAEKMHRETLALMEKVLGKKHPDALTSMSNVGHALSSQGKYTEAEKMHRETLALREKVLGKEHPETLASIGNLKYVVDKQESHTATVDTRKQLYR